MTPAGSLLSFFELTVLEGFSIVSSKNLIKPMKILNHSILYNTQCSYLRATQKADIAVLRLIA